MSFKWYLLALLLLVACAPSDSEVSRILQQYSSDLEKIENQQLRDQISPSFQKYFPDPYPDGLSMMEVGRRDVTHSTSRTVEMKTGEKTVTVLDGYRVLYAYPDFDQPFVKIHVEQSSPENFEADKAVVLEQLKGFENETLHVQEIDKAGRKFYVLNMASFDVGVRAMALLFVPEEQMIVTMYLLNQEKSPFKTEEEFLDLEEKFFNGLAESLNKVK